MQTHYAQIVSSGRIVPVQRMGKILVVIHPCGDVWSACGWHSVSICRYDKRFKLMPKGWEPPKM